MHVVCCIPNGKSGTYYLIIIVLVSTVYVTFAVDQGKCTGEASEGTSVQ